MNVDESRVAAGDESAPYRVDVDPHGERVVPWQQSQKGGSREDRMKREVTVSLPPKISDYEPRVPSVLSAQADDAIAAIARLDSSHGESLTALSLLLLRAESVASSKIENVEASLEDYARAAHGYRANESANSMVASAKALESLISSAGAGGLLTLENVLIAHRTLMADDPAEAIYAGRLRDMQNWIEGSDYSPRDATYVPPPPKTVEGYLADLFEFANRDDVPVLVQAAVAHAQFESIHPFTDGNGRISRALVNTILRRRGITSRVVVPLASVLVAKRETYFNVLSAYREGDAGPIIRAFVVAARTAARESERSARRLAELPDEWTAEYLAHTGRTPRTGSAARRIIEELPNQPFFTAEHIEEAVGGSTSAVYSAIESLVAAAILRPLTNRKRDQIWCASAIIDELEDLGRRVARRATGNHVWEDISSQAISSMLLQNRATMERLSEAFAHAGAATEMLRVLTASQGSEESRRRLLSAARVPEIVMANLGDLGVSPAMRSAIEMARQVPRNWKPVGTDVALSPQLQRSLKEWEAFTRSLARTTRLPEAVLQSMDAIGDEQDVGDEPTPAT
ncbi:Fic family protein [Leucobacter sp. G161]|uniref:Fic family protein n=1 Tax=Leucobacter sp. G161 TaxID=663704 RepID=UPI000A60C9D3|nr:Fic family protein [Leucobacter sp. G161]